MEYWFCLILPALIMCTLLLVHFLPISEMKNRSIPFPKSKISNSETNDSSSFFRAANSTFPCPYSVDPEQLTDLPISFFPNNTCQYTYVTPGRELTGHPFVFHPAACAALRCYLAAPPVNLTHARQTALATGRRLYPQPVTGISRDVHGGKFYNKPFARVVAARLPNWLEAIEHDQKVIMYNLDPLDDPSRLEAIVKESLVDPGRVELRHLPYGALPPHIADASNYSFKILIIAMTAAEFGASVWLDAGIQWAFPMHIVPDFFHYTPEIDWRRNIQNKLKKDMDGCFSFISKPSYFRNKKATHERTDGYLTLDDPNAAHEATQHSLMHFVYNTPFCRKHLLLPALACTLHRDCVTPDYADRSCRNQTGGLTGGWNEGRRCHRFDQSVLNNLSLNFCGTAKKRNDCSLKASEVQDFGMPEVMGNPNYQPRKKSPPVKRFNVEEMGRGGSLLGPKP